MSYEESFLDTADAEGNVPGWAMRHIFKEHGSDIDEFTDATPNPGSTVRPSRVAGLLMNTRQQPPSRHRCPYCGLGGHQLMAHSRPRLSLPQGTGLLHQAGSVGYIRGDIGSTQG